MHYTGTLVSDGSKFDSSVDKGRPFRFKIGLGMVIKGWDGESSRDGMHTRTRAYTRCLCVHAEGVMQMSLGEKAILTMTPDYGYGARGAGGVIPPNADLKFEVELLKIGDKGDAGDGADEGCCVVQ